MSPAAGTASLRRAAPGLLVLTLVLVTGGCNGTSWIISNGRYDIRAVSFGQMADDLDTREATVSIDAPPDGVVRIRNLAGAVTIEQGDVETVEITALVSARGSDDAHTAALLDAMAWTMSSDTAGRAEWTLAYPVQDHQSFHYSHDRGYEVTARRLYERTVTVSTERAPGRPTLFADVTITCPPGAAIHLQNVMGTVTVGDVSGSFDVAVIAGDIEAGAVRGRIAGDTWAGTIRAASVHGGASMDTGSGDVRIGLMEGSANIDTGSGDIVVDRLDGDAHLDTGSGDIEISSISASDVHADTGSGDIVIRDGSADRVHADTGSGRIDLVDVTVTRFHGDTGSGDITIRGSLAEASWIHGDTGSGSIAIHGGPDESFVLEASVGGSVHVGYDGTLLRYDGNRLVGAQRGSGGPTIHVDTGSGGLEISPG